MEDQKKYIDWLNLLPAGYREKALAHKRQAYTTQLLQSSMASALAGAFAWHITTEGYAWWKQVHDFYTGENPTLPPLQ